MPIKKAPLLSHRGATHPTSARSSVRDPILTTSHHLQLFRAPYLPDRRRVPSRLRQRRPATAIQQPQPQPLSIALSNQMLQRVEDDRCRAGVPVRPPLAAIPPQPTTRRDSAAQPLQSILWIPPTAIPPQQKPPQSPQGRHQHIHPLVARVNVAARSIGHQKGAIGRSKQDRCQMLTCRRRRGIGGRLQGGHSPASSASPRSRLFSGGSGAT